MRKEQREYDSMTNDIFMYNFFLYYIIFPQSIKRLSTLYRPKSTIKGEFKTSMSTLHNQLGIIANMFISVFAMFGVGYYVSGQYGYSLDKVKLILKDKYYYVIFLFYFIII
jgi:hypothetical protein